MPSMEAREEVDTGRPTLSPNFSKRSNHLDASPPQERRESDPNGAWTARDQRRTMTPPITNSQACRHSARPPPAKAPTAAYYLFAASVMMITSSMVSTFWLQTPLPFCSRFWVLLGGADDCYWKPYPVTIFAACVAYASAAIWWYRQHRHWRYQNATIAAFVLLALGVSLISGVDAEAVLCNALPWSLYTGLVVSALLSWRYGARRRAEGIPLHNVNTMEL